MASEGSSDSQSKRDDSTSPKTKDKREHRRSALLRKDKHGHGDGHALSPNRGDSRSSKHKYTDAEVSPKETDSRSKSKDKRSSASPKPEREQSSSTPHSSRHGDKEKRKSKEKRKKDSGSISDTGSSETSTGNLQIEVQSPNSVSSKSPAVAYPANPLTANAVPASVALPTPQSTDSEPASRSSSNPSLSSEPSPFSNPKNPFTRKNNTPPIQQQYATISGAPPSPNLAPSPHISFSAPATSNPGAPPPGSQSPAPAIHPFASNPGTSSNPGAAPPNPAYPYLPAGGAYPYPYPYPYSGAPNPNPSQPGAPTIGSNPNPGAPTPYPPSGTGPPAYPCPPAPSPYNSPFNTNPNPGPPGPTSTQPADSETPSSGSTPGPTSSHPSGAPPGPLDSNPSAPNPGAGMGDYLSASPSGTSTNPGLTYPPYTYPPHPGASLPPPNPTVPLDPNNPGAYPGYPPYSGSTYPYPGYPYPGYPYPYPYAPPPGIVSNPGTAPPPEVPRVPPLPQKSTPNTPAPGTGTSTPTTSTPGAAPSPALPATSTNPYDYQFSWYDNVKGWSPYPADVNFQIAKAYLEKKPALKLTVGTAVYTFDLVKLLQANPEDHSLRKVDVRIVPSGKPPPRPTSTTTGPKMPTTFTRNAMTTSTSYVASSPVWYWDRDGTFVEFGYKEATILEKAYSAHSPTASLTINGQSYLVTFSTMTQTNTVTKMMRKLKREEGKKQPSPLTNSYDPVHDPLMACPIPHKQVDNLALITISDKTDEWKNIESNFRHTMASKGTISSIVRVANKMLWKKFVLERDQVMEKNGSDPTITYTRLLFHGTRNTTPEMIYNSESGFMMQFSSKGMWGTGTYFAEKAVYSHDYCHHAGGKKQIFLAVVVTGDTYDCKPDGNLKVPPERTRKKTTMAVERYDSVTGITNGSRVYIVYENNKAYPLYLITYT